MKIPELTKMENLCWLIIPISVPIKLLLGFEPLDSTSWGLLAVKADHLIGTTKEGREEGDMGGGRQEGDEEH